MPDKSSKIVKMDRLGAEKQSRVALSSPTDAASAGDFASTASWDNLRRRAELMRCIRTFFDGAGFLEVETPILSADTVIDRHLEPFHVTTGAQPADDHSGRRMWLQTSPEFAMKRLLASGAEAIYQVTRAFREGEAGRLHNQEFTIVEWYRRDESYSAGMDRLSELIEILLNCKAAERLSYQQAFELHAGVSPHACTNDQLRRSADRLRIPLPSNLPEDDRDVWLDLLISVAVAPQLGWDRPTILYDFPASQAALAQVRDQEPPVAERFELFVDGVELANGYHELIDANELRRRNERVNAQRINDGHEPLPVESRLLAAMDEGMPPATGVALGFDRTVMLAVGAKSLAEVMAFPFDRA